MLQHALDDIVATFPCSVIFSRLPVSISIVSSISTLSSRAVKAGAVVSFNSSSNSRLNQREFATRTNLSRTDMANLRSGLGRSPLRRPSTSVTNTVSVSIGFIAVIGRDCRIISRSISRPSTPLNASINYQSLSVIFIDWMLAFVNKFTDKHAHWEEKQWVSQTTANSLSSSPESPGQGRLPVRFRRYTKRGFTPSTDA